MTFSGSRIRTSATLAWPWLLLIALAALALAADPDLVRDNDQAAMLAGALRLSEGESPLAPGLYGYDRSWLAYALTAGVYRTERFLCGSVTAVPTANLFSRLFFWGAWAVFLSGPARRGPACFAAVCMLAAPAVWLTSVYWNTTALASACIALGAWALGRRGRLQAGFGALCFAAAAGMRADALLLAPILVWLFASPRWTRTRPEGWVRALLGTRGAAAAAAMGLAVGAGAALAGGRSAVSDLFFDPRVVLGYLVFGAGSLAAVAAVTAGAWRPARRNTRTTVVWVAGLLALLLPWLFYLPQLHTPRYLLRGGEAVLLLALSARGRVWLRRAFSGPVPLHAVLAAVAALPWIAGVSLPSLTRPRPTVTAPTWMPTGDGVMPMGGLASFAVRLRRASEIPLDHNQAIWKAVRETRFPADACVWPVLVSPQIGLFELRAAQEGALVKPVSIAQAQRNPEGIWAETRMLLRRDPKQPGFDAAASLLDAPAEPVSPNIEGLSVVRFGEGDGAWSREIRLLRRLFEGAEYRIRPVSDAPPLGHTVVFFSETPFAVRRPGPDRKAERVIAERDAETGYHASVQAGLPGGPYRVEIPLGATVRQAVRVWPDWMRWE